MIIHKYFVAALVNINLKVPSLTGNISGDQTLGTYTLETAADLGVDVSNDYVSLPLREALVNATLSHDVTLNQYTNFIGHDRFLNAVAQFYSLITNQTLNPQENVIATIGATEALLVAYQTLIKPGDEWIIIEPFWPKSKSQVESAYGIPRYTNLKLSKTSGNISGSDWIFDKAEFASLFNNKTRGVLLNNPNNPSGKLYTRSELEFIADLVEKWDVIVVTDEAHEWAVCEPHKIVKFGTLPGMFNRTLTVGTASKAFSAAGWRIGWMYGPAHLIKRVAHVHEYTVQNAPTPQQIAIAYAFEEEYKNYGKPFSHFKKMARETKWNRDYLAQALRNAGMVPIVPDGGNCMMSIWPKLMQHRAIIDQQPGDSLNEKFANWMKTVIGVFGFPLLHYYGEENHRIGDQYMRFCYQKKRETLELAADRLKSLRNYD